MSRQRVPPPGDNPGVQHNTCVGSDEVTSLPPGVNASCGCQGPGPIAAVAGEIGTAEGISLDGAQIMCRIGGLS
jgi:hypothetical protein